MTVRLTEPSLRTHGVLSEPSLRTHCGKGREGKGKGREVEGKGSTTNYPRRDCSSWRRLRNARETATA